MIHILSQDGKRMVNAEQVAGYEIRERMAHGKLHWEYDINALLPCNGCILGTFTDPRRAKETMQLIGQMIAGCHSGNSLLIVPPENVVDLADITAPLDLRGEYRKMSADALRATIETMGGLDDGKQTGAEPAGCAGMGGPGRSRMAMAAATERGGSAVQGSGKTGPTDCIHRDRNV